MSHKMCLLKHQHNDYNLGKIKKKEHKTLYYIHTHINRQVVTCIDMLRPAKKKTRAKASSINILNGIKEKPYNYLTAQNKNSLEKKKISKN